MDDVETARMSFPGRDDPHSAQIVASSHHAQVTRFELDEVHDLVVDQVVADSVVDFDQRVGIADGAAVVCRQVRDTFRTHRHFSHFQQLVRCLLFRDLVQNESAFHIVQQAEEVVRLLDRDDVCTGKQKLVSGLWVIQSEP